MYRLAKHLLFRRVAVFLLLNHFILLHRTIFRYNVRLYQYVISFFNLFMKEIQKKAKLIDTYRTRTGNRLHRLSGPYLEHANFHLHGLWFIVYGLRYGLPF